MKDKIIQSICSPLGFFVLSLLVVEGFLGIVLTQSTLTEPHQFYGLLIGVVLFLIVVVIVSLFVWLKPDNLTFNSLSHLINSGKVKYGDSTDLKAPTNLLTEDLSQKSPPLTPTVPPPLLTEDLSQKSPPLMPTLPPLPPHTSTSQES